MRKVFAHQAPQAAVIDLGLPGIDGLKLASMLRTIMQGAPVLLLVAVSGHFMPDDRVATAGYDHYLLKPIDVNLLLGFLSDHVTRLHR